MSFFEKTNLGRIISVLTSICGSMLCDFVAITSLLRCMEGTYLPQTGVYCDACCAHGAVSACAFVVCFSTCVCIMMLVTLSVKCTWHMCLLYVCVVVLGAYLVLFIKEL